jgi:hypothetical protein
MTLSGALKWSARQRCPQSSAAKVSDPGSPMLARPASSGCDSGRAGQRATAQWGFFLGLLTHEARIRPCIQAFEEWMVEQWEIARPGNGGLHRIAARSRQYRASRRLLYEIAVASDGGMKWWTVLAVQRNASQAEIRTAFHDLLKRYHLGTVAHQKKPLPH